MAVGPQLTLVVNPGSSSRKYGLYANGQQVATLKIEQLDHHLRCSVKAGDVTHHPHLGFADISHSTEHLPQLLQNAGVIDSLQDITRIVVRIVAPTGYFLQHRVIDDEAITRLHDLSQKAPLHIVATLQEIHTLKKLLPEAQLVGVSDSAFHAEKPARAWNYALPIHDTDRFEVKRFGYHGISASAVVYTLESMGKLPRRLIVCHLGSGASVTAINNGKSIDNTMGYTPLEGLVMATRSGTIDAGAYATLKHDLHMDDAHMQRYLNMHSGLAGLSGISEGVKTVLEAEANGNHMAGLAIETYVYSIQKAIGQMAAALQGADMIVFTGTVGERAAVIRERVMAAFHFLDFYLDEQHNMTVEDPQGVVCVSRLTRSKPVFVVPANEDLEMYRLGGAL